jgi:hypothetical protein
MTDVNPTNTNHEVDQPNLEDIEKNMVDPRDLVSKGGYRKHPREIVENPAVTPQMLDEPQETGAGFIREDRDEAEQ